MGLDGEDSDARIRSERARCIQVLISIVKRSAHMQERTTTQNPTLRKC